MEASDEEKKEDATAHEALPNREEEKADSEVRDGAEADDIAAQEKALPTAHQKPTALNTN
jgi:hypothetical protein